MDKKLFIETYGCQMNVADSEVVASVMKMAGYETTDNEDEADAIRDELARQKITPTPVPTKVVEKPAVTPEPVEKKKANLTPILVPAVLLAGGGTGYAYYRYRRKKQAEAEKVDPDADYREDEFDFDDSYGEEDGDEPYDEA